MGNANAQNPGQQSRGMTILKTPVILHGECNGSKPRATDELSKPRAFHAGNAITQNPGHLARGMSINDKTPVLFGGECNCSKPRATNEGNGHQQNPGPHTRGTQNCKTPGNKRGEWSSSKPRATNGGNAKLQNPGPLTRGMELPGTPVKDMSPGPRRPEQQNPGFVHVE